MATDNRVLFHRMANTLNYLDIKHVLTSCGTCIDHAKIGTLPASLILSRLLNGAIDVSLGRGLSKMVTNNMSQPWKININCKQLHQNRLKYGSNPSIHF
jgi:hypothetical protein